MKRIAIAGINHETNTYCRDLTPLSAFMVTRGEKLFRFTNTETAVGGALSAGEKNGFEPVPILVAFTQPSGIIERAAYDSLQQELLHSLAAAMPVDGVFLDLHGAGVVDGIDDMEGHLTASIRELVGADVPVTASFDLHGNISQAMCDALDGVFACHQYPHIDLHLRAIEAVDLIADLLNTRERPQIYVNSLPMIMPTTTTFEGIGKDFLTYLLDTEAQSNVIDISWFHGFPYADTPLVGTHIVVTTKHDQNHAADVAQKLGDELWRRREEFRATSLSADEAVAAAATRQNYPVVINETSDNCGGGAPGDGTHLLRAMIDAGLKDAAFGFVVDEEVAAQAHAAGVGASLSVKLGGKTDELHGKPLSLDVYVKALHDGRLTMQAMFKGSRINYGKLARLQYEGIEIIVASKRSQTFDAEPFLAVGIDVTRLKYVALKSSNHFRGGFQDIAAHIITADPPGLTTHHIEVFERKKSPASLWPL